MKIYTDSPAFCETILGFKPELQEISSTVRESVIQNLVTSLFTNKQVYEIEIAAVPFWNYMFITEHAPKSQFFILLDLLKNVHGFNQRILCLAGSGSNFKGYRNRSWQSLTGNIHLSLYLNPNQKVENFHVGFTIISCISVAEAIKSINSLNVKPQIKWVNDILLAGKKVSGVLTQTQTQGDTVCGVFIGIGLNVEKTPKIEGDNFVPAATCLWDNLPRDKRCSIHEVLERLLQRLSANYTALVTGNYNTLLEKYTTFSNLKGEKILVYSDPMKGTDEIIHKGVVECIGNNLEIYLKGQKKPVTKGRIVFAKDKK